ncbi:MAG: SdpI family protein [Peptostreptococcaceae bacterium]
MLKEMLWGIIIIITGISMYFVGGICKYLHDDYQQYPNIHAGYKTRSAMKNKETWKEANNYIYKASSVSLVFVISFMVVTKLMNLKHSSLVYCIVQILIFLGPIVSTEIHLYKFNKYKNINN